MNYYGNRAPGQSNFPKKVPAKKRFNGWWIYLIITALLLLPTVSNIFSATNEINWPQFEKDMLSRKTVEQLMIMNNANAEVYIRKELANDTMIKNVFKPFERKPDEAEKKFLGSEIYENRRQIPVLCYHNIRQKPKKEDPLWISEARLNGQLKMLHDSGYHTILPDQLYQYLTTGKVLPSKSILISFDDTYEEHFSIAVPILNRYGFKAVFFAMTVSIGKINFMTAAQIKILSYSGHVIGCHTWNHPNITTLNGKEWERQIDKPRLLLEKITGKTVSYFAYPYGAWNDAAIIELKKRGINAAFQLTGNQSEKEPLFTVRRLMVSGSWTGNELQEHIKASFKN